MPMDTKVCQIADMKLVKDKDKNYLTGYANTKNQADSYGDIPTNFNGEDVYVLDRMKTNPVCFVDHRSSATNIAGNFVELQEDPRGLYFKLLFRPLDEIYNPNLKDAVSSYINGYGRALSIGGRWFFGDPKNPDHLTKALINEVSLVGIGADMDALTDAAYPKHFKMTIPFNDLPVAEKDYEWNLIEADKRIRVFSTENKVDETDEEFAKAFLWRDSKKCHHLQIADVVNNELVVIPKALSIAAASLTGVKGGTDIPDTEIDGVKYHINKYYKKMGMESPFEKHVFRVDHLDINNDRLLENLLKTGVKFNNQTAKALVSSIKSNLQREVVDEGQRDAETWEEVLKSINNINKEIKKNARIYH